jgi:toxin ParE1/3/4
LTIRAVADDNIRQAVVHYAQAAGADVARRFIDAVQRSFFAIARTPRAGSPRWAHELNLPGLRSYRVKGFPWLVFYMALDGGIEVWRVIDARRDIPAWMTEMPDT